MILKEDPVPFRLLDVVKLKGFDNVYRVRLGGLRVVYAVGWNERRILIHYIGPREGAYEWRARSSRSNQRRPYFETIDSQLRLVRQKPWAKGFT